MCFSFHLSYSSLSLIQSCSNLDLISSEEALVSSRLLELLSERNQLATALARLFLKKVLAHFLI